MSYSLPFWFCIGFIILISSFLFFLLTHHWLRRIGALPRMSLWNRKKYTVNRRQSNPNPAPEQVTESNTSSPELRRQNRTTTGTPVHANRLSRSLIDLTESPTPPPLPPRRIPKPVHPLPESERSQQLPGQSETHFQLPPPSLLPVLQRNASLRTSRFMSSSSSSRVDPFVLIQFDGRRSSSSDFLHRLFHDPTPGPGVDFRNSHHLGHPAHIHQRHQSLVLPNIHNRNFVPTWIHHDDDLPPSYEDAVKMESAQSEKNNDCARESPAEKPKRFVKETAV